jgi:hypothetical protein
MQGWRRLFLPAWNCPTRLSTDAALQPNEQTNKCPKPDRAIFEAMHGHQLQTSPVILALPFALGTGPRRQPFATGLHPALLQIICPLA